MSSHFTKLLSVGFPTIDMLAKFCFAVKKIDCASIDILVCRPEFRELLSLRRRLTYAERGYQNNIIAALDSFLTGQPSDLYIQALRKTELKVISKKTFDTLIAATTENRIYWQQTLEALVHQQMEREMDLLISSPLERYQRVLKRSPHLFQEVPHKYIASYLRMTPETLSRVKKS